MSLPDAVAEARTLNEILLEILRNLDLINSKVGASSTSEAGKKIRDARVSMHELYFATNRLLGVLRQMNLPDDVQGGVMALQRMLGILHNIYLMMNLINAASGPFGWIQIAIGLGSTTMMVGSSMSDLFAGY